MFITYFFFFSVVQTKYAPSFFRPYATVVKPKKKRKRGYDSSDEMNATDTLQSTPPPSPEDSLVEVSNIFACLANDKQLGLSGVSAASPGLNITFQRIFIGLVLSFFFL